jgi:hypothetical protein
MAMHMHSCEGCSSHQVPVRPLMSAHTHTRSTARIFAVLSMPVLVHGLLPLHSVQQQLVLEYSSQLGALWVPWHG